MADEIERERAREQVPESGRREDGAWGTPSESGCDGYQGGSERSPTDRERDDRGDSKTESAQAHDGGSEGYQGDSGRSRSSEGYPWSDAGEGGDVDQNGGSAEPSDDGDGYLEALAAAERKREQREERRAPKVWLPGPSELDGEDRPGDEPHFAGDVHRGRRSGQLGLRLRPRHFERLGRAARLYGVRPTTLARMMVVRGVNAILDSELERDRELLVDD